MEFFDKSLSGRALSIVRVARRRHSGLVEQNAVPWSSGAPPFSPARACPLLPYPPDGRQPAGLASDSRWPRARWLASPSLGAGLGTSVTPPSGRSLPASVALDLIAPPNRRKGPNP